MRGRAWTRLGWQGGFNDACLHLGKFTRLSSRILWFFWTMAS